MEARLDAPLSKTRVVRDTVTFRGHPLVRALHPTTIEVTTESHLTPKGDCIVGVSATKGCAGLSKEVKEALRDKTARVKITIILDEFRFGLTAKGHPELTLTHPRDIVIRKSDFLSDRTLALGASAAAKDIPRKMVGALQDDMSQGTLEIEVAS